MAPYRSLKAWQAAHRFALAVADAARAFPPHERFGLASRLRRAALSVPTNLAEGQGRFGPREALRFVRIAAGSLSEADYLLLFAHDSGYLTREAHDSLIALRRETTCLVYRLARQFTRVRSRRS